MSDKQTKDLNDNALIADALVRLSTLEKLLVAKGIFTQEEFDLATGKATANIIKVILQKANVPGDIDSIIKNLPGYQSKFE